MLEGCGMAHGQLMKLVEQGLNDPQVKKLIVELDQLKEFNECHSCSERIINVANFPVTHTC